MAKWYSLFSHTGKETETLKERMAGVLELHTAITNNMDYVGSLPCRKMSTDGINSWLLSVGNIEPGSIITLNGYMRILPVDVLKYLYNIDCKIFNIHPAPIMLYPELKGADPQERMYKGIQEGKYDFIGNVIHLVDEGVDTGPMVSWSLKLADPGMTEAEMNADLREMALEQWVEVLQEVVNG